jgi:hypothetical protein
MRNYSGATFVEWIVYVIVIVLLRVLMPAIASYWPTSD